MPTARSVENVLFRLLADASVEFIGMCDAEFRPFYVNPAGQRLVGLASLEAACAVRVEDFFFPEDQAYISGEFFPRVLREGAAEVEVRFRHFVTGEAIWMLYNVFALRDVEGHPVGYATVSRDIHRRKIAEEALREREELLELFIEHAPASIAMLDLDMRYLAASRRWLEDFGLVGRELRGLSHYDVFPDIPERWREVHRRCLAGAVERAEADGFERADGSVQWLQWEVHPWRDADGVIGGLVFFSEDITARRNAEALRERLGADLRQAQKLESLGAMAGGIAHQFNNLLTTVLGNCELAQVELPRGSPAWASIEAAMGAAQRAGDLTAQLLAFTGKGAFVIEEIDLSRLIDEMKSRISVSISPRCAVRYELARALPTVSADATQVRQVVLNLVLNASEAIGERGGTIMIRTDVVERGHMVVPGEFGQRSLPTGRYVVAEVVDDGVGIPEEFKTKLFDPFFTTKFTGRGLGLPAVFGIVRAHRGLVEVESEVGRGTTVRVLLPASPPTGGAGDR